ncbi:MULTISPECIES: AAA family ATPase [unclassified Nocardioides]|uniref:AAA family ATPase n=1 Tax=unclassified Nocardioides TaxID=2615069 RepID=UPI0002EC06D1|nr:MULTISPECIES: AAA family ATPase [unclassified Nocardioides]
MDFDQPPVVRVWADPDRPLREGVWPADVPAVAQLVREGLELSPFVTFLVGENGSGKSTIVEAVAAAFGLSPEGGSTQGHHSTRPTESALGRSLRRQRGLAASRWGFFLRAETRHGWYTFEEQQVDPRRPRSAPLCAPPTHPCSRHAGRDDPRDRAVRLPAHDLGGARARPAPEGLPGRPGRYLRHVLDRRASADRPQRPTPGPGQGRRAHLRRRGVRRVRRAREPSGGAPQ